MNTRPLANRFSNKYERIPWSGCWIWTGALHGGGPYGTILHGVKQVRAHRVSYELHRGPIPAGMDVCHYCDEPLCVNPGHLFLGTRRDNTRDKVSKGRQVRGEQSWSAKLTAKDIADIRADRRKQTEIEKQYGLAGGTVSKIKAHLRWKHLP